MNRLFWGCKPDGPLRPAFAKTDRRYWEQRLVQSSYGKTARPRTFPEYSARIEHEGTGILFPLGSADKQAAAARALAIYRTILADGWPNALRQYPREITLAIFWAENPMVFTYTTLYTIPNGASAARPKRSRVVRPRAKVSVAIIEPDDGCRRALADWICGLPEYQCRGLFSTGAQALPALQRRSPNLVLFNRQLPDLAVGELLRTLQHSARDIPAFGYRIYDTSDELFVSQPGTSGGYYFRRRPPGQLLEPIVNAWRERLRTSSEWQACIGRYVSKIFLTPLTHEDAYDSSTLTAREHDILNCLCKGRSDKGIASALNISVWTVHTHLKKIYEKLGAHSRTEAVIKYLQK